MEKSVATLLEAGDLSDKNQAKREEEELARKHVLTEEVAAWQKELVKLRSSCDATPHRDNGTTRGIVSLNTTATSPTCLCCDA